MALSNKCKPNCKNYEQAQTLEMLMSKQKENVKGVLAHHEKKTVDMNRLLGLFKTRNDDQISELSRNEVTIRKLKAGLKVSVENKSVQTDTPQPGSSAASDIKVIKESRKNMFKLIFFKIWQKNFEKSLKKLLRRVMRAAAKPKSFARPDEPSASGGASSEPQLQEMRSVIQMEVHQLNSQILNMEKEIHTAGAEAKERAAAFEEASKALHRAIDEIKKETHTASLIVKQEIAEIKKSTSTTNSVLAELRQSQFELLNGLKTMKQETTETMRVSSLEAHKAVTELAEIKKSTSTTDSILTELRQSQFELLNGLKTMKQETTETIRVSSLEAHKAVTDLGFTVADVNQRVGGLEDQKLKAKFTELNKAFEALKPNEFIQRMDSTDLNIREFKTSIPSVAQKVESISLQLMRQDSVLEAAKELVKELSVLTKEKAEILVKEKRLEADRELLERNKIRVEKKRSFKAAKLEASRNNIRKAQDNIRGELVTAVPKVVSFVREWASLTKGDIFLFRGRELIVDETFNPSLRITHLGQEGDKWEAQKYANGKWYDQGIYDLITNPTTKV
jgi:hypothetical protein